MSYPLNYSESFLTFDSAEKAAACCDKINASILLFVNTSKGSNYTQFPLDIDGYHIDRWNHVTQLTDYSVDTNGVLLEKWIVRKSYFFCTIPGEVYLEDKNKYFPAALTSDDYDGEIGGVRLPSIYKNPNEI